MKRGEGVGLGADAGDVHFLEGMDRPLGLLGGELLEGDTSGGDGEAPGPDGLGAGDVMGGVADDQDFVAAERVAVPVLAAAVGDFGQTIAVGIFVPERAEHEALPELVVAQFDFGAEADIASEQAEGGRVGEGGERAEERSYAREHAAGDLGEEMVEPEDVIVEESRGVFRGGIDAAGAEELVDDGEIGAPGEGDA